jgi:hypothetical protein
MARYKQPGLDGRHRNVDGTIHRKRSDTLIGTLRNEYGADFAPGVRSDMRLGTYLVRTDYHSLDSALKHR